MPENVIYCDILMTIMLKYLLQNFYLLLTISPDSLSLQIFPVVRSSSLILNLAMGSSKLQQRVVVIKKLRVSNALKWLHQRPILVPDVAMFIVEKEAFSIT